MNLISEGDPNLFEDNIKEMNKITLLTYLPVVHPLPHVNLPKEVV